MDDRPRSEGLRVFRWLLPGIYLGAFALLMMGNFFSAGHTPAGFQFLIPVIAVPCYLIDLPLRLIPNLFLKLTICFISGTIFSIAAGLLIDLLLTRLRSANPNQI